MNNGVPAISELRLRLFRRRTRGYFRRSFSTVRVSGADRFVAPPGTPLVLCVNHVCWWDSMLQVLLAEKLLPYRDHYVPMNESTLVRYPRLRKIGFFGIELNTARGGAQMVRRGLQILEQGGTLWIAPQGRTCDVRERPLTFRRGISVLASRVPGGCTVLPVAAEYSFWGGAYPEVLCHAGKPIRVNGESSVNLLPIFESRLTEAMDELRDLSIARDARAFEIIHRGRGGGGDLYGIARRVARRLLRR